jgi:hypothetical protein
MRENVLPEVQVAVIILEFVPVSTQNSFEGISDNEEFDRTLEQLFRFIPAWSWIEVPE